LTIFNPNACACFITFKVTWDPCPFRILKCQFVWEIPLSTNVFEKPKNFLNRNVVVKVFFYIVIQVICLHFFM
jgi:hypothetical protein